MSVDKIVKEVKSKRKEIKKKRWTFLAILKLVVYVMVVLLLGSILFWLCLRSILDYSKWPIYTETNIVSQNKAKFPSMTFCALKNGYKENVLKENGISSVEHYNDFRKNGTLKWSSDNETVSDSELFKEATYSFSEIVKSISVRSILEDEKGEIHETLAVNVLTKSVIEQRHRAFGRCYTYCPHKHMRDTGIYYLKIRFNIDAKVYFHSKNQFLDLSGRLGYKIVRGHTYETQVTVQDVLQIDYKNVHNGIIFYESDRKCSFEEYDQCMYRTLTSLMKESTKDNCTAPWVHGHDKICTKPEDIKRTFWISWNRITNQRGDCLTPCNTTLINIGGMNKKEKEDKTQGKLIAYFSSSVVQSHEHYYITIIKLAGQIGGYIGLFRLSLFLLGMLKFHTLIEDVLQKESENDKNMKDGDSDKPNESHGDDPVIGLSALAINNSSMRVN